MKKIILIILLFGVSTSASQQEEITKQSSRLRERIISVFKRKRYDK
jgi:hypothetical protein